MIRIPLCWPFNNFRPANWHAPQLERYCRPPSDFGSCRLSGFTFCFATGEEASTPRPSLVESSIACSCALSLGESRSFSTRSGRMETIPPTTRVSTNILLWTRGMLLGKPLRFGACNKSWSTNIQESQTTSISESYVCGLFRADMSVWQCTCTTALTPEFLRIKSFHSVLVLRPSLQNPDFYRHTHQISTDRHTHTHTHTTLTHTHTHTQRNTDFYGLVLFFESWFLRSEVLFLLFMERTICSACFGKPESSISIVTISIWDTTGEEADFHLQLDTHLPAGGAGPVPTVLAPFPRFWNSNLGRANSWQA